jgi:hypothetical protein
VPELYIITEVAVVVTSDTSVKLARVDVEIVALDGIIRPVVFISAAICDGV